jgi:hypothetical protein
MVVQTRHVMMSALAIAGALAVGGEHAAKATAAAEIRPPVRLEACASGGFAAASSPLTRPGAVALPAGQVRNYQKPDITFSASTTTEGEVQIEAAGVDFGFRKKVQSSGRYTLDLEAGRDKVTLRVTESEVTVKRGGQIIIVTPDAPEAVADSVQRLLADSGAVRKLRTAGALFEAAEDDSPAASALLLSDAIVGALTGDTGAPRRVARLLAKRARALSRTAGQRPGNCYSQWEQTMMWVWMDFEECAILWNWGPWCTLRWTLQTESAWFSLLACSGLGLR